MTSQLSSVIGTKAGKTGFVCGMGPSLRSYLDSFKSMSLDKDKNCFVCCNDFDLVTEISADFWVLASSVMTIERINDRLNKKNGTTVIYANSVDVNGDNFAEKLLGVNHIHYDQRHFRGLDCSQLISDNELKHMGGYDPNRSCCPTNKLLDETIQEILQRISGYDKHYGTGETVALHMLALAVILGLNPIYVVGVELDYTHRYVDERITNNDTFEHWMPNLMRDFSIINESAKKMGVEIINLSVGSKLSSILKTEQTLHA